VDDVIVRQQDQDIWLYMRLTISNVAPTCQLTLIRVLVEY